MRREQDSIYDGGVDLGGTMNDVGKRRKPITVPFGRLQAVGGLMCLFLAYCVIVIILRYGFDVELWNPYR